MLQAGGGRLASHWIGGAVVASLVLGVLSLSAPSPGSEPDEPPPAPPPCPQGPVALTFDDGPSSTNTMQIVRILSEERVRATFFVIGSMAAQRPEIIRTIVAHGHRIHNHTYDHPNLTGSSDQEIRSEVRRAQRALRAAGAPRSTVVRPPYGAIDARVRRVLRAQGYRPLKWTIDTRDWQPATSADDIVHAVADGLERRAVVLLHDTDRADATVAALPRIIRTVRSQGHCFGLIDQRGRVVRAHLR